MPEPGSWDAGEYPGQLFFDAPPLDPAEQRRLSHQRRRAHADEPDPTVGLTEDEERDRSERPR